MKKHSKLMLKALSFAAGFLLAVNGIVVAAEANPAAAEVAVLKDAPETLAPVGVVVEEKHEKGKRRKGRGKNRDAGKNEMVTALLNTRIDEHATSRRKDKNSLYSQYEEAKAADAASVKPKTLTEIGMMIDDSARRLELFKYIEANKAGTIVLDADKVAFRKMLDGELETMRKEAREVRELVEQMALENNFSLMSEEDLLAVYRKEFNGGHKRKSAAPQRKHHNKMVDADADGQDDRDANNDGKVSQAEKKAPRKARSKKARTSKN